MPVNETNAPLLSGFSAGLQTIGLHGLNFDRFLDGVISAFVAEPHEHHEYSTSARGAAPDLRCDPENRRSGKARGMPSQPRPKDN